jgi:hypothetical protein
MICGPVSIETPTKGVESGEWRVESEKQNVLGFPSPISTLHSPLFRSTLN